MLRLERCGGAIFDLDGVLTDTASLHRKAWGEEFADYFATLPAAARRTVAPFRDEDYRRLVDGKLRQDGARAVLVDRRLPVGGSPQELEATAASIASGKDERYRRLLASEGPRPYASSLELVRRLRLAGVRVAVATASRHARDVLALAGIDGELDALVDGRAASAMGLAGKPEPDTLIEAARRLGVAPQECFVVDDAVAGVVAGKRGGFAVIGVDRTGNHEELAQAGADLVLGDLAELSLAATTPVDDPFLFSDADDDDELEGVRETIFSLGNGYLATRASRADAREDARHYPGTYLAGVYDRLRAEVEGQPVDEDAIVNVPNWMSLSFISGRPPLIPPEPPAVEHRGLELDLRRGVSSRRYVVTDAAGRRTRVLERRLISMSQPHLAAIEASFVAENWSGRIEIRAGLDGMVRDDETIEEHLLGAKHLDLIDAGQAGEDGIFVLVQTVSSRIAIAEAARARLAGAPAESHVHRHRARVARTFVAELAEGQRVTCEKVVAIYASRDPAVSDPLEQAEDAVRRAPGFAELAASHEAAWARLWARGGLAARDDTTALQRLINLHLFHVLQVASPHVVGRDVGLSARGLAGEGYLGHVFWDELFVLPLIYRRNPSIARSLLDYRARRLERARQAARDEDRCGAMFPWQSASDGRDETPRVLFNPRSGRWMEDRSRYQRHVGLAVARDFWQYFETSGDDHYLFESGAEVILEVARYFADLARFDADLGRYRICGVMGPDEFHDGYPWRSEPGVDDNAYTNVMTAWLLDHAVTLVDLIRRSGHDVLLEAIGFEEAERDRFEELSHRLYVPFIGDVIAQFEGYDRLEPIDLAAYRERYGDLARLDLILEAEGDTVRRYQVGKQPDALMLFYLLSAEELRAVLGRMGYRLEADSIRKTVEYYSTRVTHGSSLSRVVHAWVLARLDRSSSWRYLSEALEVDVHDLNRGTTREGVHLGAMAGTIDLFERCYSGLESRADALWLNPVLPDELASISFRLNYRGHLLSVEIDHDRLRLQSPPRPPSPITVMIGGEPRTVSPGQAFVHALGPAGAPSSSRTPDGTGEGEGSGEGGSGEGEAGAGGSGEGGAGAGPSALPPQETPS